MKIVKIEQIFKTLSEEKNYIYFKNEVDNYNLNNIFRKFLIYGMILIYFIQIYLIYIGFLTGLILLIIFILTRTI